MQKIVSEIFHRHPKISSPVDHAVNQVFRKQGGSPQECTQLEQWREKKPMTINQTAFVDISICIK